jgi:xanthine dehydrogenase YagT iron-sulfur-binding subunit
MTESAKNKGSTSGFSRRAFLKGSGAVAAASALATQQGAAEEQTFPVVVQGTQTITLDVNGQKHQVEVEPRTTLLEVLRYQLDLTGAKPVSTSDGASGASTVLIDRKPVTASTTLAITCPGKKIETIESLGGENPDEVVRAFVDNDAQQCGFCTPGFVVAVRAVLNRNPNATEEQIRRGLNSNICRCGTYAQIINAALAVVKGGGNG